MNNAYQAGLLYELRAARYVRRRGYRLLNMRYRARDGEIDLIARRWRTTVFVEVKARRTLADLDSAIDSYRLRRVSAAVRAVSHLYARPGDDIRIDVILIAPRRWPRHLVNVWQDG